MFSLLIVGILLFHSLYFILLPISFTFLQVYKYKSTKRNNKELRGKSIYYQIYLWLKDYYGHVVCTRWVWVTQKGRLV